ncbi:phenoloxidase-activating factor 1-like isoform X1 [Panulirus ornatus]|uniref:phenoloxidase-activating factor 1-like isoform X1 n=1 Tax=Panulirus ornatus TaxID=150431 RepID=UPI003A8AB7E0
MGSEKRVCCSLGVWGAFFLLLQLVQLATSQTDCPHPCIKITECPELLKLLKNHTQSSINELRKATCFISGTQPMVCCPKSTTPVVTQPPVDLLPKDCGQGPLTHRIHGGKETPIDAHMWMAALGYSADDDSPVQFLCGGSVINERYVLTAAHCVDSASLGGKSLKVIRLGDWDLSTEEDCEETPQGFKICAPPIQDFTHEEIIRHPQYNTRAQISDDIALIRLSRPIVYTGSWIQPICLPPQGLDVKKVSGQREPLVSGWGFTENGTYSNRKLDVSLPFVDTQICNATYRGEVVPEQICLGGRAGQDSCRGDSGGPLVVAGPLGPPYLLIGVVSYGPVNCGQQDYPGIYTSVSHYKDWILSNIRP